MSKYRSLRSYMKNWDAKAPIGIVPLRSFSDTEKKNAATALKKTADRILSFDLVSDKDRAKVKKYDISAAMHKKFDLNGKNDSSYATPSSAPANFYFDPVIGMCRHAGESYISELDEEQRTALSDAAIATAMWKINTTCQVNDDSLSTSTEIFNKGNKASVLDVVVALFLYYGKEALLGKEEAYLDKLMRLNIVFNYLTGLSVGSSLFAFNKESQLCDVYVYWRKVLIDDYCVEKHIKEVPYFTENVNRCTYFNVNEDGMSAALQLRFKKIIIADYLKGTTDLEKIPVCVKEYFNVDYDYYINISRLEKCGTQGDAFLNQNKSFGYWLFKTFGIQEVQDYFKINGESENFYEFVTFCMDKLRNCSKLGTVDQFFSDCCVYFKCKKGLTNYIAKNSSVSAALKAIVLSEII